MLILLLELVRQLAPHFGKYQNALRRRQICLQLPTVCIVCVVCVHMCVQLPKLYPTRINKQLKGLTFPQWRSYLSPEELQIRP